MSVDVDVDDGAGFAAAVAPLIASLGGAFMISPQAKAFRLEHGLGGKQFYVRGRGSVLGEVDADVVTAAMGFWPADVVREAWDGGRAILSVDAARDAFVGVSRTWGRTYLASFEDAGRLAELCSWVVDGTDVAALPLYAGWRAVDLPSDDLGRVSQLLQVLREHRGGLHLLAVVASGLTPLQAVLAGPGGTGNASFYGWEEPFEDISGHQLARGEAEALTDRLVTPAYDVLGHDERLELLALLSDAARAAFGPEAA